MQQKKGLGIAKDYVAFDSSHIPVWTYPHTEQKNKNKKKRESTPFPPLKQKTPALTTEFLKEAAIKMGKNEMYLYLLKVNSPVKFRFLTFFGRGNFKYGYKAWESYEEKALTKKNHYCIYIDKHKIRGPLGTRFMKITSRKMRFTAIVSFNKFRKKVDRYITSQKMKKIL